MPPAGRKIGPLALTAGRRGARAVRWLGGWSIGLAAGCAPPIDIGEQADTGRPPSLNLRSDENRPCFHPEQGNFDTSCLTEAELAALLADSDRDGRSNLDELREGGDPFNSSDGPDIDGDGIDNGEDDDVDGDGVPNRHDFDVDGDRIFNSFDPDIDSDGLLNDDDPDADGDGLSDRWDLNDDGDDEPDDEDEDEDDDVVPKEKFEDLIDRLKDGDLTDADKNAIVNEITDRLGTLDQKAQFQAALIDVIGQALSGNRQQAPGDAPPGIAAVDAVYRQLADSLAAVRAAQDDPKAPLKPEQLRQVARDFVPRADAVAKLGRTFQTLSIDELSTKVGELRNAVGATRFPEVAGELGSIVDPAARGDAQAESDELFIIIEGVSSLAKSFPDALGGTLLNTLDSLRDLAGAGDEIQQAAELIRLLNRMDEIAADNPSADIQQVLQTVVDEETP